GDDDAAVTLTHRGQECPRGPVQGEGVDVERADDGLIGGVEQVCTGDDPGVVGEHIDWSGLLRGVGDCGAVGDVDDPDGGGRAGRLHLGLHGPGPLGREVPEDDLAGSAAGGPERYQSTDAAAGTRDQDAGAAQRQPALVL